jgi:hypothetical protein
VAAGESFRVLERRRFVATAGTLDQAAFDSCCAGSCKRKEPLLRAEFWRSVGDMRPTGTSGATVLALPTAD